MFDGVAIVGGVSATVTLNDVCALLPCASAVEQLTVVVPTPNVVPEAGAQLTWSLPSTASEAVGVGYVTAAPDEPPSTAMFDGVPLMEGGVVSWTSTLKLPFDVVLSFGFVNVHETGVVPSGNVLPLPGEHEMPGVLPSASETSVLTS